MRAISTASTRWGLGLVAQQVEPINHIEPIRERNLNEGTYCSEDELNFLGSSLDFSPQYDTKRLIKINTCSVHNGAW